MNGRNTVQLLIVLAVAVIVALLYMGEPQQAPAPPLPVEQELSPSALARIAREQVEREAKAAMRLKLDPVIARLVESEGITRDDLVSYFEKEVMDDMDLDNVCSEHIDEMKLAPH